MDLLDRRPDCRPTARGERIDRARTVKTDRWSRSLSIAARSLERSYSGAERQTVVCQRESVVQVREKLRVFATVTRWLRQHARCSTQSDRWALRRWCPRTRTVERAQRQMSTAKEVWGSETAAPGREIVTPRTWTEAPSGDCDRGFRDGSAESGDCDVGFRDGSATLRDWAARFRDRRAGSRDCNVGLRHGSAGFHDGSAESRDCNPGFRHGSAGSRDTSVGFRD